MAFTDTGAEGEHIPPPSQSSSSSSLLPIINADDKKCVDGWNEGKDDHELHIPIPSSSSSSSLLLFNIIYNHNNQPQHPREEHQLPPSNPFSLPLAASSSFSPSPSFPGLSSTSSCHCCGSPLTSHVVCHPLWPMSRFCLDCQKLPRCIVCERRAGFRCIYLQGDTQSKEYRRFKAGSLPGRNPLYICNECHASGVVRSVPSADLVLRDVMKFLSRNNRININFDLLAPDLIFKSNLDPCLLTPDWKNTDDIRNNNEGNIHMSREAKTNYISGKRVVPLDLVDIHQISRPHQRHDKKHNYNINNNNKMNLRGGSWGENLVFGRCECRTGISQEIRTDHWGVPRHPIRSTAAVIGTGHESHNTKMRKEKQPFHSNVSPVPKRPIWGVGVAAPIPPRREVKDDINSNKFGKGTREMTGRCNRPEMKSNNKLNQFTSRLEHSSPQAKPFSIPPPRSKFPSPHPFPQASLRRGFNGRRPIEREPRSQTFKMLLKKGLSDSSLLVGKSPATPLAIKSNPSQSKVMEALFPSREERELKGGRELRDKQKSKNYFQGQIVHSTSLPFASTHRSSDPTATRYPRPTPDPFKTAFLPTIRDSTPTTSPQKKPLYRLLQRQALFNDPTPFRKLQRIVVAWGLPEDIFASTLAHELIHAYIFLKGFNISHYKEEGLCNAVCMLYVSEQSKKLSHQILYLKGLIKKLNCSSYLNEGCPKSKNPKCQPQIPAFQPIVPSSLPTVANSTSTPDPTKDLINPLPRISHLSKCIHRLELRVALCDYRFRRMHQADTSEYMAAVEMYPKLLKWGLEVLLEEEARK